MKTLLILISFLFMTVCYAAPPPDPVAVATDEVAYTADINQVVEISVQEADAQEVAFNCVTYSFEYAGYEITFEPAAGTEPAEKPVIFSTPEIEEAEQPPLNNTICGAINNSWTFRTNRQHSNFGYPLTAN